MDHQIFDKGWDSEGTVCGWGSEIKHTHQIRDQLPHVLRHYNINILNDAGCGDLNWISTIDLGNVDYHGYDLVERPKWNDSLQCSKLDITKQVMRNADMILCRDVFIHLPNDLVSEALDNFRQSSPYVLTTSFTDANNDDRMLNPRLKYNKINLSLAPFNLGQPLICIQEDYSNKYTCLWRLYEDTINN